MRYLHTLFYFTIFVVQRTRDNNKLNFTDMNYYFFTENKSGKFLTVNVEANAFTDYEDKDRLFIKMETEEKYISFIVKKGVKKFDSMIKKFIEEGGKLEGTDQQTNEQFIDLCDAVYNGNVYNEFVNRYTENRSLWVVINKKN